MKGNLAKKYLENYFKRTDFTFEKYFQKKIEESKEIGCLPVDLMARFGRIARRGKKIRGALVVLGYELAGGSRRKAIYDTSLFIELAHAGLLVHDDIQDQDVIRRGLPTIHKQYEKIGVRQGIGRKSKRFGESIAINIGTSAYFLSLEKLLLGDFPHNRLVEVGRIFADYIIRVAHGQALDASNIFLKNIGERELLNILRYKSAEYTGVLPLIIGATLAGLEDRKILSALKRYGLCLGWAFQIQDDILGTFGNEEKLGKTVGLDIKEGKVTLLVLHLAKHGNKNQKSMLRNVLGNKNITRKEVFEIQEILKEAGSYDYVINLGWEYVKKGEKQIPKITKDKKLQEILKSFLAFMMERTL
jgi:geranylgeranyl diphosphate synthase type I